MLFPVVEVFYETWMNTEAVVEVLLQMFLYSPVIVPPAMLRTRSFISQLRSAVWEIYSISKYSNKNLVLDLRG